MKVLVIGSGGREHAIAWKLKQSPQVEQLFCIPGNGGTAGSAENVSISLEEQGALAGFAQDHAVDFTVIGPEAPLVAGLADYFRSQGLAVVGPSLQAARLEGSKAFAKEFMERHQIPTARYQLFTQADDVERALKENAFRFPVVLKADGLAAGKGVFICDDLPASLRAVDTILRRRQFGEAGARLVVEEFLEGEEASFMVLTDGRKILPLVPSQDHKAIFENDQGPNTGGMGAYSTDQILSPALKDQILEEIIRPAVQGMAAEGSPFSGILYAGLMLTPGGPRVLEFNVRLGDPEAQVVLPRLKSDLAEILWQLASGDLSDIDLEWRPEACVCVVVASEGYPGSYETGRVISGLRMAAENPDTVVFHAGTQLSEEKIVTSGGRVLGVTALAASLEEAAIRAYAAVNKIRFEGMYYRRDIAAKGMQKGIQKR